MEKFTKSLFQNFKTRNNDRQNQNTCYRTELADTEIYKSLFQNFKTRNNDRQNQNTCDRTELVDADIYKNLFQNFKIRSVQQTEMLLVP